MLRTNMIKALKLKSTLFKTQSFKITYDQRIFQEELEQVEKFKSSTRILSAKEVSEVARLLSKNKTNDQQVWDNFEKNVLKNITSLEDVDLRKICSAFIANQRGSDEIYQNLAKKQKEIGLKMGGIDESEYETAKENFAKLKNKNKILPRPMRFFLWAYTLRWRFIARLEKSGLFFK